MCINLADEQTSIKGRSDETKILKLNASISLIIQPNSNMVPRTTCNISTRWGEVNNCNYWTTTTDGGSIYFTLKIQCSFSIVFLYYTFIIQTEKRLMFATDLLTLISKWPIKVNSLYVLNVCPQSGPLFTFKLISLC